jgi:cephalosporin-C deacetylase-like acetyl esterase
MRLVALLTLLAFSSALRAQEKSASPLQILNAYLQAEAKKHFDLRRQTVANLRTPDDIHKRQANLKTKFLEALGGFPEKTPLNAKVVGTIKADGFRVEKVIYESRTNHHVTANLYLPDASGPVPGVLLPCGHSANGKAAEPYQRACILLAQNGMAVLCYDPIGQGERNQLLDKNGKPLVEGTNEHTMIGVGALLVGQTTATYCIWDGIRSLDYLASRPEVDAKRLGCTGNSGGGTLTAYLMALDDRIVAAAPSCYLTTLEKLFATIGPQDAEQNIPGQVAFGMEHADFLTMRAPLPTLMAVATHDYFNIDGAWTTFREASRVFAALGHGERVAIFEFEDKHGFSKPRREAAMRWLRRWLVGKDDAPVEVEAKIFTDAQLQCTRSGQVLVDFRGKSAFDLNADQARALAKGRPAPSVEQILQLIGLPASKVKGLGAHFASTAAGKTKRDILIHHGYIQSEPGLKLSLDIYRHMEKPKSVVIFLHDDNDLAASTRLDDLVKAGHDVAVPSLRGMGESLPEKGSLAKKYFGADQNEAFLAMHLNRPLLGHRVVDLLTVVEWLGQDTAPLEILALGNTGPIALHAAALDKRIAKVMLERSLFSWQNVVETPISYRQLANVVPSALRAYDLPDLAALLAPRPLTLEDPVNAQNLPAGADIVAAAYRACRDHYRQLGADKSFVINLKK